MSIHQVLSCITAPNFPWSVGHLTITGASCYTFKGPVTFFGGAIQGYSIANSNTGNISRLSWFMLILVSVWLFIFLYVAVELWLSGALASVGDVLVMM